MTTIDASYEIHNLVPSDDASECRFRTVFEGQEVKCTVRGQRHQVHRYIAPKSGRSYSFELVDLEADCD